MSVVAKLRCISIELFEQSRQVKLSAVTTSDPNDPNASWSKWTPAANLSMTISNPAAYEQFKVGGEYLVTFQPIESR